jgi:sorting nexin-1/2
MAKTNMPDYKKPEMDVSRRFTDFFNLQKLLQTNNPGVIVPPCPPKDAVGGVKVMMKSSEQAVTPFIEKRQYALQRFLKRVVAHPELINDPALHQFLETDEKIAAPKKDLLTMLSLKLAPVEVDEWFDDKTRELQVLETQLKKLHSAASLLCDGRKDLSHHTTRFAESFAALAQAEDLKQLTSAMHRLADVEAKVAKLHNKQATRDMFDFSEIIHDYILLIGSCKVALVQRGERLKRSQEADTNMVRKQETEQKLKGLPTTKPEKLTEATNNVQDAERKAKEALASYVEIARRVKQELERFDVLKIRDFTHTCISYVKEIMNMEQLIIKEWEAFLPEAKAISL